MIPVSLFLFFRQKESLAVDNKGERWSLMEHREHYRRENAMKNTMNVIVGMLIFVWASLLILACGGLDAEAPAMSPLSEASWPEEEQEQEEEKGADKGDQLLEISAGGEAAEIESETSGTIGGGGEEGGEDGERRCARICFKLSWCNPEGIELAECVENCEEVEYSGIVKEEVFECLDDAPLCRDVARCEDRIESCAEICGVGDHCGFFEDGQECMRWCSEEIWSGRLDWSTQWCVESRGGEGLCEEVQECGLRWREEESASL